MLGLGEQIGGDEFRVGGPIGDDQRLGRPVDCVDAHHSVHATLGCGDESVARSENLVDRADRLRPVCQRRDRLRAADLVDGLDARNLGGHELERVDGRRTVLRWDGGRGDDDFGHSGHLRRDGRMQHGRGVHSRSAGDVEADSRQRSDELAESSAGERLGRVLELHLVVAAHAVGGVLERQNQFGGDFRPRLCKLLFCHDERIRERHRRSLSQSGALLRRRRSGRAR